MKIGNVLEFKRVYADDKGQALKPLEEASEVLEVWKAWRKSIKSKKYSPKRRQELEDKIADCIQACVNLAAALGIKDLGPAMRRCALRNKRRGRYN